jgi:hypothetical protein
MTDTWADIFGLQQGQQLRDEGMARTEAADVDGIDRGLIDGSIEALNAWFGAPWSANDLRRLCPRVRQPLIGARIRAAAKAGRIVHVGYTPSDLPSTHAHDIKTWRAA